MSQDQIALSEILGAYGNHASTSREEIRALRKYLQQPLESVYVGEIRAALNEFEQSQSFEGVLNYARQLQAQRGESRPMSISVSPIAPEALHLVCYEYVCS